MKKQTSQPSGELAQAAASRHLGWCMLAGIRWFTFELLPSIQSIRLQENVPMRTKARVIELQANIYFVNDELSRALKAYQEAARATPHSRALRRQIEETQFLLTLKDVDADVRIPAATLTKINRLIMDGHSKAALTLIPTTPEWATTLIRIRAMWSGGDDASTLAALLEAIQCDEEITFQLRDWFYIPDCIWECNALWRYLLKRSATIKDLGLCNFRDTKWSIGPTLKTTASIDNRALTLVLRLHVARTSGDIRGMERLHRKFPTWLDAEYCVSFFRHHGRFPIKREFLMSD